MKDELLLVGVVPDEVRGLDDELAGEARVALERRRIGSLPERAAVAFVHRDRVRQAVGAVLAARVAGEHAVEEDGVVRYVDLILLRDGELAEVVLADAERRAPGPVRVVGA